MIESNPHEHQIPAPLTKRSKRVLIVDDNVDAAEMTAAVLRMSGYATAEAHDGAEALSIAATFRPDVALLDIGLPVMDGYELAGRLRSLCGAHLLLLAVTGYGQPGDRRLSADAGFHHHLTKPVDFASLEVLIEASTMQPSVSSS